MCVETREITREETEITETREMGTIEGRLHDTDGVKDEHRHTEVVEDNGGELAGCLETRYRQLGGPLREGGEVVCPLEATHDQVGSVVSSEFEGASAADECTESLGGIETPGTIEVAQFPSVIVPVCMVSRCVFTSVAKCVLQRTHSGSARACVRATPCVEATPCVSGVVTSVPGCVLPSTPCVSETPSERHRVCE